jgi:hypothetical protein
LNAEPHIQSRTFERTLAILFVLTFPLVNPWVRGDGVGYYAFARAPLIEHNLDFLHDYQYSNSSFREGRLDESGHPFSIFRTATGHLDNHFTVGPAILWAPFLVLAHLFVLAARALGSNVAADGFSAPYRIAMGCATAIYGFFGLLLSFRLARQYVAGRWAFLATVAIWWASSLSMYMYFNPSWSHAHSAFAVALFLFYWHKTFRARSPRQWCLLGLIAGLMLNVYYANVMLLVVLLFEALPQYRDALRPSETSKAIQVGNVVARHLLFAVVVVISLLPTFITRQIVYGSPFASGYVSVRDWMWGSPAFVQVLFSSNHGLLSWTPILFLSLAGLILFARRQSAVGIPLVAAVLAFYLLIACYPDWAGISSYGNRFFVSLTAIFIIGLAVFLDGFTSRFVSRRAAIAAACVLMGMFVVWNVGLMFQWGTHLVPARGPIDFPQMMQNQFTVVPRELASRLQAYFFHRRDLMRTIEERDLRQLKNKAPRD